MKRVLILAYDFPPRGGGGVMRTVKFVKYLREFDWYPTVVAPNWEPNHSDETLNSNIAGIEIVRTGIPAKNDESVVRQALNHIPGGWRLESFIRRNLQFPDAAWPWIRQSLPTVKDLVKTGKYAVIYSTSPPVTAHLIAHQVKQKLDIPWVADFRDPWSDNQINNRKKNWLRMQRDRICERRILRHADAIIANTPTNRDTLISKHRVPSNKVTTIPNGYDEQDFQNMEHIPPDDYFQVAFTGSAYANYTPHKFIDVFHKFLLRRPDARIRWLIAGNACQWAKNEITDPTVLEKVILLGQIPHTQIPNLLGSSHLLVLMYPSGLEYSIPGKLYEYLRSGTPIMAVSDRPSEVHRVLSETSHGSAFRPDEVTEMVDRLESLYRTWTEGKYERISNNRQSIQQYSRRHLTQQLSGVLNKAMRQPVQGPESTAIKHKTAPAGTV